MSDESSEGRTAAATADDADSESDAEPDGAAATDSGEGTSDAESTEGASPLADRVEEYDAELAEDVSELESRLAEAESELDEKAARIDELEGALKRSKADFKNYKKRAKRREEEIRERATEDFVGRIVSVRDNLVRALDQDEGADIRSGIESAGGDRRGGLPPGVRDGRIGAARGAGHREREWKRRERRVTRRPDVGRHHCLVRYHSDCCSESGS